MKRVINIHSIIHNSSLNLAQNAMHLVQEEPKNYVLYMRKKNINNVDVEYHSSHLLFACLKRRHTV